MGTAITYGPLQHGRGIQRHCNTASDTYCDTAGWLVRRKSRRGLGESPERPAKGVAVARPIGRDSAEGSTPVPRVAPQLAGRLAVWGPSTRAPPTMAHTWLPPDTPAGWKWGTGVGGKAQLECRPVECPVLAGAIRGDLVRAHRGVSRRRAREGCRSPMGPAGTASASTSRPRSRRRQEASVVGLGRGVTHPPTGDATDVLGRRPGPSRNKR